MAQDERDLTTALLPGRSTPSLRPLRSPATVSVSAAMVVALGVLGFGGCDKGAEASSSAAAAKAPQCSTCVIADERGFTPSHLELKAGAKGETKELTFTRTSDETCARDVVFPELNIKEPLPLNKPVTVRVPVEQARTLTFQCGMAMYKSSVVVK